MNFIFAIALLVISYTITALTTKRAKNTDASPAGIQDFSFPQHDEGTPQAVVFGDVWIEDPMILYYGNLKTEAIRVKSGGGKK